MGWVSRGALRRAVFVLLLLAASRLASAWPEEDDTSIEAQLGRWLLSKGAELVRAPLWLLLLLLRVAHAPKCCGTHR